MNAPSRLALLLLLASLIATPCLAKSKSAGKSKGGDAQQPEETTFVLQDTGVAKVDKFYDRVENIVGKLQAAQADIDAANSQLSVVLGLPEGTPLADALTDLKEKAAGEVRLVLEGDKPRLEASDAVPSNLREAVDATNALMGELSDAVSTLRKVKQRAEKMPGQARQMPRAIARSDLDLVGKAQATVIATQNLSATRQVATETGDLLTECRESLKLVRSTFGD